MIHTYIITLRNDLKVEIYKESEYKYIVNVIVIEYKPSDNDGKITELRIL